MASAVADLGDDPRHGRVGRATGARSPEEAEEAALAAANGMYLDGHVLVEAGRAVDGIDYKTFG